MKPVSDVSQKETPVDVSCLFAFRDAMNTYPCTSFRNRYLLLVSQFAVRHERKLTDDEAIAQHLDRVDLTLDSKPMVW